MLPNSVHSQNLSESTQPANPEAQAFAEAAHQGAMDGSMSFPQILGMLMQAGFEGYFVDLRAGRASYYRNDGSTCCLSSLAPTQADSPRFDVAVVRDAIREAQTGAPGYTWPGFCEKVAKGGCVGYLVSLPGRRVLYLGRTGELHVEHFPS